MKVLWFANTPCGSVRRSVAGTTFGSWLVSLEDELKKRPGIELNVAFLSPSENEPFVWDGVRYWPVYDPLPSNPVLRVLSRRRPQSLVDAARLRRFEEIVRSCGPDIIHVHGTEESFGLIGGAVSDIPVVFSIQGLLGPISEKYFAGIPSETAFKADTLQERLRAVGIRDDWKRLLFRAERERRYLTAARYVLGRTSWDSSCTLSYSPSRQYFTVNELLRGEFRENLWKGGSTDRRLRLVTTVSCGLYKGYETLLRIAASLVSAGADFEWNVIGSIPDKLKTLSETVAGVRSEDLPIVFHGLCDASGMCEVMASCDVFVQVSHIENSPNSLCEAMMLGMPVIASAVGGTSSLLDDGVEGLLYDDGCVPDAVRAVLELGSDPERTRGMGAAARKRALARHDGDRVVGELLSAYEKIIGDAGKDI